MLLSSPRALKPENEPLERMLCVEELATRMTDTGGELTVAPVFPFFCTREIIVFSAYDIVVRGVGVGVVDVVNKVTVGSSIWWGSTTAQLPYRKLKTLT